MLISSASPNACLAEAAEHATNNNDDALYIDCVIARLTEARDTPVLRHKGVDIPAADFLKSIYRYARAFSLIGIERGSLVTLFAPNTPDALAVRYAAS